MKNNIFVSTNAFGNKRLKDILNECKDHSISNIELSRINGHKQEVEDLITRSSQYSNFNFQVHNYCPPPKVPFVLNLASKDTEVLNMSRDHCLRAIDLIHAFQAPFFGFHCGFCFDAQPHDLGSRLTHLPRYSLIEGEEIFIESLRILSDYAKRKGVLLAIENNVLSHINLIEGRNELLLGVRAEEIIRYINNTGRNNIHALLDVAHLKVSAESLGFDPHEFIMSLASHITGVHFSDNDGKTDSNDPVTEKSWFWKPLKGIIKENTTLILEVKNLKPVQIIDQSNLINSKLFPIT